MNNLVLELLAVREKTDRWEGVSSTSDAFEALPCPPSEPIRKRFDDKYQTRDNKFLKLDKNYKQY